MNKIVQTIAIIKTLVPIIISPVEELLVPEAKLVGVIVLLIVVF